MSRIQRRVRVRGRVQGVGFRAATRAEALRYPQVIGTVQNLEDGSVEAVFAGEDADVQELLRWCSRGPAGAQVDALEIREERPLLEGDDFRILR